jgi:hypothetical protein
LRIPDSGGGGAKKSSHLLISGFKESSEQDHSNSMIDAKKEVRDSQGDKCLKLQARLGNGLFNIEIPRVNRTMEVEIKTNVIPHIDFGFTLGINKQFQCEKINAVLRLSL